MEEWKEYKLAEVCENIYSGGTPSSMNASYWNGNLPWLSSGETSQRYIYYTEKCITKEGADNSSTRYAFKGSTVIASAGQGHTRGQASMLCIDTYVNQSVLVIKPNPLIINPYFLYFNIDSRYNELRQLSDGTSTRGSLSGKILKDLKIYLPPLNEQQKIASILKSLDDKIEVNRKINENLEQQAQALFKSWFVDFEPFKNGEFIESELGMIPKGWRVVELQDVLTIKRGGSPRPIQDYLSTSGYRWLKISDATACQSPYIYEIKEFIKESGLCKTIKLSRGSLVLSNSATPGIPKILGVDSCIHDGWLYFPQSQLSKYYLYMLFKEKRDFLLSQGNGSVFTNLKTDIVKAMKIAIPNEKIMSKFNTVLESLFILIEDKTIESRRLAELRDTLLPKLMSGELKVCDIVL